MKTIAAIQGILALLVMAPLTATVARAEILENSISPFSSTVFIDCDRDGTAEDVLEINGELHTLVTTTVDKNGGVHTTYHYQPVNVSGVSLNNPDDLYNAVGITAGRTTVIDGGENVSDTFVNNFYMIGRKSGIKYFVHQTYHLTVVDGEVVVQVDKSSVTCR